MYDGYTYIGDLVYTGTVSEVIHSQANNYANASEAGVTWYANLPGAITGTTINGKMESVVPTKLYGYAEFKLNPKTRTDFGTSKLYGHYVHATTPMGIGLSVDSNGSWNLSGSFGSDYTELGNDADAVWGNN